MLIEDAPPVTLDLDAEMAALAERYRKASGPGIQVLNLLGSSAEGLLDRLPETVRDRLDEGTEKALFLTMKAAHRSRGWVADQPGWLNTTVTTAMGAAGGFGGLPTAMAELPVTTAVLLRAIQGVAVEHGFDAAAENVQFDCVQVFASAGPLAHDDGADMAFLATRMALRGASMQALVAKVAPVWRRCWGRNWRPKPCRCWVRLPGRRPIMPTPATIKTLPMCISACADWRLRRTPSLKFWSRICAAASRHRSAICKAGRRG